MSSKEERSEGSFTFRGYKKVSLQMYPEGMTWLVVFFLKRLRSLYHEAKCFSLNVDTPFVAGHVEECDVDRQSLLVVWWVVGCGG